MRTDAGGTITTATARKILSIAKLVKSMCEVLRPVSAISNETRLAGREASRHFVKCGPRARTHQHYPQIAQTKQK